MIMPCCYIDMTMHVHLTICMTCVFVLITSLFGFSSSGFFIFSQNKTIIEISIRSAEHTYCHGHASMM